MAADPGQLLVLMIIQLFIAVLFHNISCHFNWNIPAGTRVWLVSMIEVTAQI